VERFCQTSPPEDWGAGIGIAVPSASVPIQRQQSGDRDRRGPLTKHGPKYLRWALLEATMHALRHPAYSERDQHTKQRLGKQRGAKVAQIEVARRLTHAIWHMLTKNEAFNAAAPMTPGPPARRR